MRKLIASCILFLSQSAYAGIHIMQGDNVTASSLTVTGPLGGSVVYGLTVGSLTCTGSPCGSGSGSGGYAVEPATVTFVLSQGATIQALSVNTGIYTSTITTTGRATLAESLISGSVGIGNEFPTSEKLRVRAYNTNTLAIYGAYERTTGSPSSGDGLYGEVLADTGYPTTGRGVVGTVSGAIVGGNAYGVYGLASATGSGTNKHGVYGSGSGTGAINYGGRFTASGATTNIGAWIEGGQLIVEDSSTFKSQVRVSTSVIVTSSVTADGFVGSGSGAGIWEPIEGSPPGAGSTAGAHNVYFDSSNSRLYSHENAGNAVYYWNSSDASGDGIKVTTTDGAGTAGNIVTWGADGNAQDSGVASVAGIAKGSIRAVLSGGGQALTAGSTTHHLATYPGTITGWAVVSTSTGSLVVDVKKCANASCADPNCDPTTSIAGTEKPTLSSEWSNGDTALGSWTTSIALCDKFAFVVNSVDTIIDAQITLFVTKD